MTLHAKDKGIIHTTTSYEQLNFIRNNISRINAQRLLETDPAVFLLIFQRIAPLDLASSIEIGKFLTFLRFAPPRFAPFR